MKQIEIALDDQVLVSIDTGCSKSVLISWFVAGSHPSYSRKELVSRDEKDIFQSIDRLISQGLVSDEDDFLRMIY